MGFITFYELSCRSLRDLLLVSKRIKFGSPFALDTICSLTSYLDLKKKITVMLFARNNVYNLIFFICCLMWLFL